MVAAPQFWWNRAVALSVDPLVSISLPSNVNALWPVCCASAISSSNHQCSKIRFGFDTKLRMHVRRRFTALISFLFKIATSRGKTKPFIKALALAIPVRSRPTVTDNTSKGVLFASKLALAHGNIHCQHLPRDRISRGGEGCANTSRCSSKLRVPTLGMWLHRVCCIPSTRPLAPYFGKFRRDSFQPSVFLQRRTESRSSDLQWRKDCWSGRLLN